jgi:hypothetical protein
LSEATHPGRAKERRDEAVRSAPALSPSALRAPHTAASPSIMENSLSRYGNWRRDARITFNSTEAVKKALEDAACCRRRTVSDVIHEMATDWAMGRAKEGAV